VRGARAFGWQKRSAEPRSMRDGNTLIGWGFASSTYPTNRRPAEVRVRMNRHGGGVVQTGTQDLGTGTYTVMSQVAADALGVPLQRIRFELGDSSLPPAPVSGGSSTVPSVAPAVQAACQALVEKIKDLAVADPRGGWRGQSKDALQVRDGLIVGPDRRVPIASVLDNSKQAFIEAEVKAGRGNEKKKYSMHAFGAQFAEVRVDQDLGEIRVSRYVGAFDGPPQRHRVAPAGCAKGRSGGRKVCLSPLIGTITRRRSIRTLQAPRGGRAAC